jgi:hypothetical protein
MIIYYYYYYVPAGHQQARRHKSVRKISRGKTVLKHGCCIGVVSILCFSLYIFVMMCIVMALRPKHVA